ncbi:uncharacterized protein [Salminus brasiliensis]|uniref:uncharacterized protein n=1 Tax=Salminus brasiliensis TaxID=930266 RepID=UPI003B834BDA
MEEGEVAVVLAGLQQCLQKEGLGPGASDWERLAALWRLYLEKDNSVRALTQEIQELRAERAAEINTVQQYVENIRSLSKTRDSVALELERDNEILRTKLDEISHQQGAQRNEIAEMLLQEGLAEVIPSNLSEQVAYLLAERASLQEKLQALETVETNVLRKCAQKAVPQSSEEKTDKVVSPQGRSSQSPLKRILGIKKVTKTKQIFTPKVNQSSSCEENASKERERWLLERDLNEASSRLDMAHKEIRRLTDELESARLTQSAYEPELQEAQLEVEQLRQEVEKLKRCDVAELRRAKEINKALNEEVHQLRDRLRRMQKERFQLLELVDRKIEDLDSEDDEVVQAFFQKLTKSHASSTGSLSRGKKSKEQDVHKRCCAELLDLTQANLRLQAELDEKELLRKKAVEECNDQSKRKAAAERLILEVQALCEQKEEGHKAKVHHLQDKLASLTAELDQLKSSQLKEHEQARQQSMAIQAQTDQAKARSRSQDSLLPQAQAQWRQLNDELQRAQDLLNLTKEELLTHNEKNGQLQRNITLLKQEKQTVVTDLQKALAKVTQLEQEDASKTAELQIFQQKLQRQQAQWERDKFLLQRELSSTRVRVTSLEKQIEELQQQLKSATQQLRVEEAHNAQNSRLEQKVRDMVEELDTLKTQAENAQKQRKHLAERETVLLQQMQTLLTTNTQLSLAKAELSRVQDQQSKEQNEARHSQQMVDRPHTATYCIRLTKTTQPLPRIVKNVPNLKHVIAKLEDSLMCSQQECEKLQIQLQHAHCNLHSQISKYQDKKDRHKEKLGEAKDVYLRETAWRDEKIKEQERELRVLMKKVEKESEMVMKVTAENEVLLVKKKQLLYQLSEEEESRKDAIATVTAMKQRVDFLEKDGIRQWDLNMIKSKQIANLEGLLQEKQCLLSTEDFRKFCSFENRIIEGSEHANSCEQGFETFDLLAFVQNTYSKPTEEPAALTQSQASEMVYLN